MQHRIDKNIIEKVYYDQDKDELRIKMVYTYASIMVIDSDVPPPLKKSYSLLQLEAINGHKII